MITLFGDTGSKKTSKSYETQRPSQAVETAGSLAMLFENGLMTMGQYDEFISSNPFNVDYSAYSDYGESVAYGGFLSDFANAMSTLSGSGGGEFSGFSGGSGGGFSSGSSGGFSSVC